jgi:AAA+ superfamily predicted ATPase
MLEYFQGIIFLTTNRINAFDPAVRSRVHMAIQFPKLTAESRRKLWMTFIAKIRRGIVTEWCDEQLLDELASEELNGRQIKNAVRTAYALAISAGQELSPHHLRLSLGTLTQFDRQLEPDFANSPADAPTPIDYGRNRKRPRLY